MAGACTVAMAAAWVLMGRLSSELLQSFQPLGIVGHLLAL